MRNRSNKTFRQFSNPNFCQANKFQQFVNILKNRENSRLSQASIQTFLKQEKPPQYQSKHKNTKNEEQTNQFLCQKAKKKTSTYNSPACNYRNCKFAKTEHCRNSAIATTMETKNMSNELFSLWCIEAIGKQSNVAKQNTRQKCHPNAISLHINCCIVCVLMQNKKPSK